MARSIVVTVLIAICLCSCATVPVKDPEAEAKVVDANGALDSLNVQIAQFYDDLRTVTQEIAALQNRPGWPDLEKIIADTPSIKSLEGDLEEESRNNPQLAEWSRQWNEPWQPPVSTYMKLADKCIILEARRLALRERLFVVEAKFIEATLTMSSSNFKEAKSLYSVVDILGRSESELDSFSTNAIGLYKTGVQD